MPPIGDWLNLGLFMGGWQYQSFNLFLWLGVLSMPRRCSNYTTLSPIVLLSPSFSVPILTLLGGCVLYLYAIERLVKTKWRLTWKNCFNSNNFMQVDVKHFRKPTMILQWMGMNALIIYALAACDLFPAAIQGLYLGSPENNMVRLCFLFGCQPCSVLFLLHRIPPRNKYSVLTR